jgi:hypothetical protein
MSDGLDPRLLRHAGRVETGRPPATAETGRRCAEPGCGTTLSRYNTGDRCYLHRPPRFRRFRGSPRTAGAG